MRKIIVSFAVLATIVSLNSCKDEKSKDKEINKNESKTDSTSTVGKVEPKIKVSPFTESVNFPDASLSIASPENDDNAKIFVDEDGAEQSFKGDELEIAFNVEGYTLGESTEGDTSKGIAYSPKGKGQHIHFIVDNGPYSAKYTPEANFKESPLQDGYHVILAFLSRSWHESVKNENSYVLRSVKIGDVKSKNPFDPYGQHMFYSRPKGTYAKSKGQTDKVILDFFLVNTEISTGGNYVEVTIDGEFTQKITEWQPYVIEGLDIKEHTIKLELKDAEGNVIPGPYNSVERKITLVESK